MARSTWWIGLSKEWEVITRTSWDAPRPQINEKIHMWIKKQESGDYITDSNMQKVVIHEYSIWNTAFLRREFFPVQKWSIVGLSTPVEKENCKKVNIHIQDPLKITKTILIESDNNWNLKKAFTKIDYKISIFESWEEYENQKGLV